MHISKRKVNVSSRITGINFTIIAVTGSSSTPLNFSGGGLKISDQNNWGGPEQKITFGGSHIYGGT